MEVSFESLVLDPFKLRVRYDDEKVDQLKGSILQVGLLSPLKVWFNKEAYWIVDGNYRYLALKELNHVQIPVDVLPEETSLKQALLIAVISNWHREEFHFMDKARSVRRLRDAGVKDLEICARLEIPVEKGYPGKQFRRYRDFEENVAEEAKGVLSALVPKITVRHSEALSLLKEHPEKQRELAELTVTKPLTGPQALTWAKNFLNPPEEKPWKCMLCEGEFLEETKTKIMLCPICCADFEVFKNERMAKQAGEHPPS